MSEPHRFFICLSSRGPAQLLLASGWITGTPPPPPRKRGVGVLERCQTWSLVTPLSSISCITINSLKCKFDVSDFCLLFLLHVLWIQAVPILRVGNQIYLQWRLCRKQKETSWVGIKRAVDGIGAWSLRGKICSRNNNTLLNELCPQFHMRLVNTKARWWKTMSCSLWQRRSACAWRTRVKGTGDGGEGDWGGNLNFTSRRRQHVIKKP